ncbi:hypothetical protein F5887DRAFT_990478 [Amanita rubescens]|nr:hypothetical protein F5887DRAFT_990478 [Amanita rubescens]
MSSPRPTSDRVPPTSSRERKSKKRKQKSENELKNQPEASGVNGSADGQATINPDVTFGEDFLAFGPLDDSEVEPGLLERRKDKGKGRETSPPPREWDRGKSRDEDRGGKRKYDMVFDFDDGYANKKQRFDWENCKNVAEMLHREVEAFTNWISPTPVEDEIRGLIVNCITKAVTQQFPDAQVFPFGSYETKLYLPLGDIDLVILSQSMAYSDRQTVLYALANTLKRAGITSKVTVIARAKVPIVKFVTVYGRINVDISVNQQNGIISGSIINGFLKDMHAGSGEGSLALRSLVLITKAFLNQRSLNEVYTGGLGSYSIVCMAISFLQMHPKIRRGEIDPDKNLGVLLVEFFELYGCYFNYEEAGISVRNGGYYFQKKQRGWVDYQKGGLVSIEDPADSIKTDDEQRTTFPRGHLAFSVFEWPSQGAHGILTSTAYLRAGVLNSRRHSQSIHLRDRYEAQDVSILSSTINHRKLVQEVYDKKRGSSVSATVNGKSSGSATAYHAVHAAWEGNDDDDIVSDIRPATYDEEEEGRYHIGRGTTADLHTVFTTDDEGECSSSSAAHSDGEHRDTNRRAGDRRRAEQTEGVGKRRYWLAKGSVGIPDEEDTGW